MPRTSLAIQAPSSGGLTPNYSAANVDGHSIVNNGQVMMIVKNASAAAINVTAQTPGIVDGLALPDKVVSVAAGGERHFRWDPGPYNQADGTVYVDFSAVTSVTVAAFQL